MLTRLWTLAPTSAAVSITGRVTKSSGRGIAFARVTMSDQNGSVRYALTNPFGYFRFANVKTGETYVFAAKDKRYNFAAAQTLNISDAITNLSFIAQP